jgi:hypothetical protein
MFTQTIHYRLHKGGATTTPAPISHTQRWPCTRTNAQRQAVLTTLAASSPGDMAYTWIRVNPPTPAI